MELMVRPMLRKRVRSVAHARRTRVDACGRPPVVVASDGCERLGIGGAGAVVLDTTPGARRLYRFCARLDPGPGTMSSYRAETVGALLPMIACWTLRHVLPPGPSRRRR